MLSLDEIKARGDHLAATLDAADHRALPAFGGSAGEGQPCVEVDERGYHVVVSERGIELERLTTRDLDELLYRIFSSLTFALASDHEMRNGDLSRDGRRLMFGRQVELLRRLSPGWAEREEEEAGIQEYWIINVRDNHIEVRRDPVGWEYRDRRVYNRGEGIQPLFAPSAEIKVDDLLP